MQHERVQAAERSPESIEVFHALRQDQHLAPVFEGIVNVGGDRLRPGLIVREIWDCS